MASRRPILPPCRADVLHPGEQGSKHRAGKGPRCAIRADVLHPGEQGSKLVDQLNILRAKAGLADVLHPGEQGSKHLVGGTDPDYPPLADVLQPTCCIQENKDRNPKK